MKKLCLRCHSWKDKSEFIPTSKRCKQCREYSKKWSQRNRDRCREYRKKWATKNKDKVNAKSRRWRKRNKDYFRKLDLTEHERFIRRKKHAKERKIEWNLSEEEFISVVNNPCHYCHRSNLKIGLDRKDNKKGYALENVLPCCRYCNSSKGSMPYDLYIMRLKGRVKCFACGRYYKKIPTRRTV